MVTDEFLKVYLARPELAPPPEACDAERALHAALLADPRRRGRRAEIAAIADADARENWQVMLAFRDLLVAHRTLEAAYLDIMRRGGEDAAPVRQPARPRDPAQRARRLRRSVRAARGRDCSSGRSA